MNKVNFKPWVGSEYENSCHGKRVLVLGESHYAHQPEDEIPEDFTQRVIREWGQERRHRFFTKVSNVLLLKPGGYLSMDDRAATWDHVAFYNFVQQIVGAGPRIRPTAEMWEHATEPFFDVLSELKPEIIIVLGKQLSDRLPEVPGNILVIRAYHPSSRYFQYDQVIPEFTTALSR